MVPRWHRLAEARSLALHREIARRLRDDPSLLQPIKTRVMRWIETGEVSSHYALAWSALLEGPRDALLLTLERDDEHACALRQASPFLGVLEARERWEIWRRAGRAQAS